MPHTTLPDLVATLAKGDARVLLLSTDARLAGILETMGGVTLTWIRDAVSATDIDTALHADVAVVSTLFESIGAQEGIQLLCRLRDCNCDCILLELTEESPSAQELLAIGFYRDESSSGERRRFRYDRNSFFELRQWNTPENWAHPENFRKYRW